MDMQADVTDFYLPDVSAEELDRGNIYKLLVGEATLSVSIFRSPVVDILPGTIELSKLNAKLYQNASILKKLDFFLRATDYDFVVIDTPGSARAELSISLASSDYVLIPVTPSKWAIRAVNLLIDEIHNSASLTGRNHRLAFVPTLFGHSKKHQEILEGLRGITEIPCLGEIPKSESIKTRTEKNQFLNKGSNGWKAFEALAGSFIQF